VNLSLGSSSFNQVDYVQSTARPRWPNSTVMAATDTALLTLTMTRFSIFLRLRGVFHELIRHFARRHCHCRTKTSSALCIQLYLPFLVEKQIRKSTCTHMHTHAYTYIHTHTHTHTEHFTTRKSRSSLQ